MVAVVPVRGGTLPLGGDEAVAEAGGVALLVGEGCVAAAVALAGIAVDVTVAELSAFAPAAWADRLGPHLVDVGVVVLPGSPDGRDLAPRLAHRLGRPLLAGAVAVHPGGATVSRRGGLVLEHLVAPGPFVATLQPGVRGAEVDDTRPPPTPRDLVFEDGRRFDVDSTATGAGGGADAAEVGTDARTGLPADARCLSVEEADPATVDLHEATRIVGGGAGLGSADQLALLRRVGLALDAAYGATRVVTDAGWVPVDRQIGTTGVTVDPRLYLAFGVSGAVQHTSGLGAPDHVIAVNTDPSCPMMGLADLAVVADAPATLAALAALLGVLDDG